MSKSASASAGYARNQLASFKNSKPANLLKQFLFLGKMCKKIADLMSILMLAKMAYNTFKIKIEQMLTLHV